MAKLKYSPILLVGFLIVITVVSFAPSEDSTKQYVCTPCGNSCDQTTFDKPGNCPVCGMPLIEKTSAQTASTSSNFQSTQRAAAGKMNVAIFIFEGVQIIDYTGPYEVFGQAGLQVHTVAEKEGAITTAMGMSVNPEYTFANHPAPDVVILPGGDVPDQPGAIVIQWIQQNANRAKIMLSVCNGAFYLAKAGLLDGLEATTFASLIDPLRLVAPKAKVVSNKRYCDNGKIITTAGLSSGIDGSIHVVERLFGRAYAKAVATGLEYNWDPSSKYVRAQLPDQYLRNTFNFVRRFQHELVVFDGDVNQWTAAWNIQTDQSAANILDSLNKYYAGEWQESKKISNGTLWKFASKTGESLNAETTVQPDEQKKMRLTVKVFHADSKSAKAN